MKNRSVILSDEREKSVVDRALEFAINAHKNQIRKAGGASYIIHPIGVAIIVAKVITNDYAIAGALLHDTVEDTDATLEEIEKNFGHTVAKIVGDLTEPDKSLPWRVRKKQAIVHVKEMDEWSLLVKTADKIHNLKSMYSAYLKEGKKVMARFNAPLENQIEMSRKLYQELGNKWGDNPLLPELKEAMEDVDRVKERYRLLKSGHNPED
ncbi:MAG: HD domain-containing protein [bacterium]|nr:HD domain-containing protein [bacterium]